MTTFLQDIRYAFRMLAKNPSFTLIAILTLAMGIGANTSLFTVVNAVLLRPLPYPAPERLMALSEKSVEFAEGSIAYPNFRDWKEQNHSFEGMVAFRQVSFNISGTGPAEHIPGRQASAGFLSVLGVRPALGRDILPSDDVLGAAPVAIISHGLWQRRFGGDPQIVGKGATLTDQTYTVVGVLPKNFWFYSPADIYVPLGASHYFWRDNREIHSGMYAIGRLRPEVSLAEARAEMTQIGARLAEAYPKANAGHGVNVKPMLDDVVGGVRSNLYLLLGAVGFVLLIACVNVANLLLVRAASREKELAVRAALGASRGRVMRQLLTESLCLATAGGALGLMFARWGTSALVAAIPGSLPRSAQGVALDGRVLAFTFLVSLLTGILFGLAPAFRASNARIHDALKEGVRGSTGKRHRMQDLLIVAEMGLALVLLVCAGLTIRSIVSLRKVNPGFNPKNALAFEVSLSSVSYPTGASVRNYFRELERKLLSQPGVEAVSVGNDVPLRDDSEVWFYVVGRPIPPQEQMPWAVHYIVSRGYRDAMGLRLSRGRFFTLQDNETGPLTVVIDEEMARGLFPNEDPVGHSIVIPIPGFDQPREIVGIVNHVKHWGLAQDASNRIQYQLYMPFNQIPDKFFGELAGQSMTMIVRTASDPRTMAGAVRDASQALDKDQAVFGLQFMDEIVRDSFAGQRFATMLLGVFAAVALVLAAVGIYGVMSYLVSQRTQEMGIRMALGATRGSVLQLILRHGGVLAAIGTGIGLVASLGLTRLLASLLFGIKATDPITFVGVALLLLGVAFLACYLPARRATRVDPMVALRYE